MTQFSKTASQQIGDSANQHAHKTSKGKIGMGLGLGLVALLLVGGLLMANVVGAQQPAQTYDLSWWTVDGGGGRSGGGSYDLESTAGQPDPGPTLSGGDYTLEGGFWGSGVSGVTVFNSYLPLVTRND